MFISILFVEIISFLDFFHFFHIGSSNYDPHLYENVFRTHITQGYLFCILIVLSLSFYLYSHKTIRKIFYLFIIILSSLNILFITNSKTAKLCLFILIFWFTIEIIFKHFNNIFLKLISIILLCLIFVFVFIEPKFMPINTINIIRNEITHTNRTNELTSSGIRAEIYKSSLIMIKNEPFYGFGLGSVYKNYNHYNVNSNSSITMFIPYHLHNEYLMQLVQVGYIGLFLFLGLLLFSFFYSKRLEYSHSICLRGTIVIFSFGCLFNSFLLELTEGLTFLLLLAVLLPKDPLVNTGSSD